MPAIEAPIMLSPRRVTGQWSLLPSWMPVPGLGALPVNSFLLRGREPLLVDTGIAALGDQFVAALEREIEPHDLRWIWLSHMDADHVGNLGRVLERAPQAKIVTNFLGMGKLNLAGIDISRVHMLDSGGNLTLADRTLTPLRPPYYDAPETIGFFDSKERAFFAADAFGALLPEPVADIEEVVDETLREGLVAWSSIDAPWLAAVEQGVLGRTLKSLERLDPEVVLSGHLPVVRKGVGALTRHVAEACRRGAAPAIDPLSIEHLTAGSTDRERIRDAQREYH